VFKPPALGLRPGFGGVGDSLVWRSSSANSSKWSSITTRRNAAIGRRAATAAALIAVYVSSSNRIEMSFAIDGIILEFTRNSSILSVSNSNLLSSRVMGQGWKTALAEDRSGKTLIFGQQTTRGGRECLHLV
jgi:hypothetical protein